MLLNGLFGVVHLVIFELRRGQKTIADLFCLKVIGHFFVFAGQLGLHFSFTQGGQQISIVRWLLDEFLAKFGKTNDLVQQELGVEVPIPFPHQTRAHLTQCLGPLLNPEPRMLVEARLRQLVALLDFKHIKDELFVQFLPQIFRVPNIVVRVSRNIRICTSIPLSLIITSRSCGSGRAHWSLHVLPSFLSDLLEITHLPILLALLEIIILLDSMLRMNLVKHAIVVLLINVIIFVAIKWLVLVHLQIIF